MGNDPLGTNDGHARVAFHLARIRLHSQLANDLGLAPGTVARAYRELDADGLVVSRRRVGTVVADRPPRHLRKRDTGALDAAVRDFARQLHQLGAGPDEAIPRLRALWSSPDRLASQAEPPYPARRTTGSRCAK